MNSKNFVLIIFVFLYALFSSNQAFSQSNNPPLQEHVEEVNKGELPKTRTMLSIVELWNYGTQLELIFNSSIGVATIQIVNSNGNILSI